MNFKPLKANISLLLAILIAVNFFVGVPQAKAEVDANTLDSAKADLKSCWDGAFKTAVAMVDEYGESRDPTLKNPYILVELEGILKKTGRENIAGELVGSFYQYKQFRDHGKITSLAAQLDTMSNEGVVSQNVIYNAVLGMNDQCKQVSGKLKQIADSNRSEARKERQQEEKFRAALDKCRDSNPLITQGIVSGIITMLKENRYYSFETKKEKKDFFHRKLPNKVTDLKSVGMKKAFLCVEQADGLNPFKAEREKIRTALSKYAQDHTLTDSQIFSIIQKLDNDNFFIKENSHKKIYLEENLAARYNLDIAKTVAHAEGIDLVGQTVSAADSKKIIEDITKEAKANLPTWVRFFNNVFYPNGTLDKKRLGNADGSAEVVFTTKHYWQDKDLDLLYSKFLTDLRANRYEKAFTCTELRRLGTIFRVSGLEEFSKSFPDTGGVKELSLLSFGMNEPTYWDLLVFVPVERAVAYVGKAAWVKVFGSKVAQAGAEIVEKEVSATGARAASTIAKASIPQRITFTFKKLGSLFVDRTKMFGRLASESAHTVSLAAGKKFAEVLTKTLEQIAEHPIYGRYIDREKAQGILDKTFLELRHRMKYATEGEECLADGICFGRVGERGFEISISDEWAWVSEGGDINRLAHTFTHETFHALQKLTVNGSAENKLMEGMTEYLAVKMSVSAQRVSHTSYIEYYQLIKMMELRLDRMYGAGEGEKIIAEAFFSKDWAFLREKLKGEGREDVLGLAEHYIEGGENNAAMRILTGELSSRERVLQKSAFLSGKQMEGNNFAEALTDYFTHQADATYRSPSVERQNAVKKVVAYLDGRFGAGQGDKILAEGYFNTGEAGLMEKLAIPTDNNFVNVYAGIKQSFNKWNTTGSFDQVGEFVNSLPTK